MWWHGVPCSYIYRKGSHGTVNRNGGKGGTSRFYTASMASTSSQVINTNGASIYEGGNGGSGGSPGGNININCTASTYLGDGGKGLAVI